MKTTKLRLTKETVQTLSNQEVRRVDGGMIPFSEKVGGSCYFQVCSCFGSCYYCPTTDLY
jgi:hypothetical protein